MIINDCVLDERRYTGATPPPATFEDVSRYGNDGTHTAITWVRLPSGLWVRSFNGATSVVTVGDCGENIQTCLAWVYPDDITTRSIIDLDGGTHSIEIDGASDITATGWAAPIIYVNGEVAAAVTIAWHFIAVTTATAIDASSVLIGREASFFDGYISLVRACKYALTADQIYSTFQNQRGFFGV